MNTNKKHTAIIAGEGTPNNPEKNIPMKPDINPDPTKNNPDKERERNDPTKKEEPGKLDPTRIKEPDKNQK